jgi:hypothetical protein
VSTAKFDKSILREWLRHDAWKAKDALLLLAGIVPTSLDEIDHSLIAAIDYFPEPDAEPIVNGFTLLDGQSFSGLATRGSENEHVETFYSLWRIFFSNPDHQRDAVFSPAYYIGWAQDKGLEIAWLDWVLSAGLVQDNESRAPLTRKDTNDQDFLDGDIQRPTERYTLYLLIAALLRNMDIDWNQRGITKVIVGMTEELGAPIGDDTVRNIIKRLDDAVERRAKS